jgi:hypothetical protein
MRSGKENWIGLAQHYTEFPQICPQKKQFCP